MRLTRLTGWITVVALLGLTGACTGDDPGPTEYERLNRPTPSGSAGAPAAGTPVGGALWTMTVSTGEHVVAAVGSTVIIPDSGLLYGRARVDGTPRWQHPFVVVHDRADGRELGRFKSWLAGAGDDWVAVAGGVDGTKLTLQFIPF